ncbi:hypothetical protein BJ085DRAFT_39906 [Dimargaris cristalligena]|uniref:Uncharacterized protein n=1 Tax=Dimargaris cristalligena TaxID=215637 RepID=A0A4P9ZKT6_9FUNG|nr:hypothetical protein BJ085DRAFT_39906 [Dimargaris cristalligena]|eukprot:RKP33678.1 hypothetical protein BJ085DRAFT_39906 [Dimargaris cristalligena]
MPTLTPSPLDSAHRAAAHAALACLSLRVQLRTLTLLSEFAAPAANLYFQLATLYYDYFREATTTTTTATTDSVDEEAATASSIAEQAWLISALQVNKAALQLQPTDPRLAQHAFIRAVTVQPKNVSAWSNLGFLYLQHGELELANRVFTQIQNLDPEFVPVWAGQALLADQLGQPTEALALYRHAFTSIEGGAANGGGGGSSSGSGGGSPRHISEVNLLLAQSYWGAVAARHAAGNGGDGDALPPRTLVQFALEKFTERDPRQPWVWHQLDLLREADRRYEGAIGAYRIARELLAQRDKPRFNGEEGGLTTVSPPEMVVLESNYARALCAGGHYTESVKIYTKLMESPYFVAATAEMEEEDEQQPQVDDTATTQQRRYLVCNKLGQGLAEYWSGQLEASLHSFERALVWAEPDARLYQDTSVLLAKVLWALDTTEHRDLAKQQLLHSVQAAGEANGELSTGAGDAGDNLGNPDVFTSSALNQSSYVQLLATLFAFGLCEPDVDLTTAVQRELPAVTPEADPHLVLPYLAGRLALLQQDLAGGICRTASKAIRAYSAHRPLFTALSDLVRRSQAAGRDEGEDNTALTPSREVVRLALPEQLARTALQGKPKRALTTTHAYLSLALALQTCHPGLVKVNDSDGDAADDVDGVIAKDNQSALIHYTALKTRLRQAKSAAQKAIRLTPWLPLPTFITTLITVADLLISVPAQPYGGGKYVSASPSLADQWGFVVDLLCRQLQWVTESLESMAEGTGEISAAGEFDWSLPLRDNPVIVLENAAKLVETMRSCVF